MPFTWMEFSVTDSHFIACSVYAETCLLIKIKCMEFQKKNLWYQSHSKSALVVRLKAEDGPLSLLSRGCAGNILSLVRCMS